MVNNLNLQKLAGDGEAKLPNVQGLPSWLGMSWSTRFDYRAASCVFGIQYQLTATNLR